MPVTQSTKEQTAHLLAEGRYSITEIAEKIGISTKSVQRWLKDEVFAENVESLRQEFLARCLKRAICQKEYRIGQLAERHSQLRKVIEARGVQLWEEMGDAGATGLVCKKIVASAGELMGYEYEVDIATLKELRAIEEAVAREMGQLIDKREYSGPGGGPIQIQPVERMSDEQIRAELQRIAAQHQIGAGSGGDQPAIPATIPAERVAARRV